MRRLYLRIYFAVIASLVVFAAAAVLVWRMVAEPRGGEELAAIIARNVLPPASASAAEQQAALERVARDVRADLALYSREGERLGAVGRPLAAPQRSGWQGGRAGPGGRRFRPPGRLVVKQ